LTQKELCSKLDGNNISISKRSAFVLEGRNIKIKRLELDGALVLRCGGDEVFVEIEGMVVRNEGWEVRRDDGEKRGYRIDKSETKVLDIPETGNWMVGREGKLVRKGVDFLD